MSNDYPLVSIIIPTYNSSDYITETLTKLEKQTYPVSYKNLRAHETSA
ncbi:glycosyltransferase, partial [Escherichia coli]